MDRTPPLAPVPRRMATVRWRLRCGRKPYRPSQEGGGAHPARPFHAPVASHYITGLYADDVNHADCPRSLRDWRFSAELSVGRGHLDVAVVAAVSSMLQLVSLPIPTLSPLLYS